MKLLALHIRKQGLYSMSAQTLFLKDIHEQTRKTGLRTVLTLECPSVLR